MIEKQGLFGQRSVNGKKTCDCSMFLDIRELWVLKPAVLQ
jgi:hypothetical protein